MSKRERLARLLGHVGVCRALESLPRAPSLLVVTYHRIGSPTGHSFDEGVFSATPDAFEHQVRYLQTHFRVLGLDQILDVLAGRQPLAATSALITFDDGYRDNFELALPILRTLRTPAVFFVPTGYIDAPRLPWWDHIAYVVTGTSRPILRLDWDPPVDLDLRRIPRRHAVKLVLRRFKESRHVNPAALLGHLEERAGVPVDSVALGRDLFMSWDHLAAAAASGVSIGSHTVSHRILAHLPEAEQWHEISASKRTLEERLGRPVTALCYPVGARSSFTDLTKRLVEQAGYEAAFSFYGGVNRAGRLDRLDVRRTGVEAHHSLTLFRARLLLSTTFGRSF